MTDIQNYYGQSAVQAFDSMNENLSFDPFLSGKVAITVQTDSFIQQIEQYAPDLNYGVAQLPSNEDTSHTWLNGTTLELNNNKDESKAQAAWGLMKAILSEDGQIKMLEEMRLFPANLDAMENPYITENDYYQLVATAAETGYMTERIAAFSGWAEALNPYVEEATTGVKTPEQALNDAQQYVENEVANYEATQQ